MQKTDAALRALAAVYGGSLGMEDTGSLVAGVLQAATGALSPGDRLAALLQLAAAGQEDSGSPAPPNYGWVLAAAAAHLVHDAQGLPAVARAAAADNFTTLLLLPLLAQPPRNSGEQARTQEAAQLLAGLLAGTGRWDLACRLLQLEEKPFPQASTAFATALAAVPLAMHVRLAAAIIQAAVEAVGLGGGAPQLQAADAADMQAEEVLGFAACCTLPDALRLLQSAPQDPEVQRELAQQLLPAALTAAEHQGCLAACLTQLWGCCKQLLADSDPAQRGVGLALLAQFARALLADVAPDVASGAGPPPAQQQQQGWRGLRQDAEFWSALRWGLNDSEQLNRKRALEVLHAAVAIDASGRLQQPWLAFFKLHDALGSFSLHLVKEAWPEMDMVEVEMGGGIPFPGSSSAALGWEWAESLWSQGLQHTNLQAQKVVAASIVSREWQPSQLAAVPRSFVVSVVAALGQPHMHRGETAPQLHLQAAEWVGRYCAAQPSREQQWQLLHELLSLMVKSSGSGGQPAQQQPQLMRTTIQSATDAAVAAAEAMSPASMGAAAGREGEEVEMEGHRQLELLRLLSRVTASLGSSMCSSRFGASILARLFRVAAAAAHLPSQPALLPTAAAWLQALPLPLLQHGGHLHSQAVVWLQRGSKREELASGLASMAAACMAEPATSTNGRDAAAAAAAAGVLPEQSQGVAVVALLLSSSLQQASSPGLHGNAVAADSTLPPSPALTAAELQRCFGGLEEVLCCMYRRPYLPPGAAARCLLLLSDLLAVALPLVRQPLRVSLQAQAAHQLDQPLGHWLRSLLESAAEELSSYAQMAAAALWASQHHDHSTLQQQQQQQPAAASAQSNGQLAVHCITGALMLLAVQASEAPGPQLQAALQSTTAGCVAVLQQCVAAMQQQQQQPCREGNTSQGKRESAHTPILQLRALSACCEALNSAAAAGQELNADLPLAAALAAVLQLVGDTSKTPGVEKEGGQLRRTCWHTLDWLVGLHLTLEQLHHAQQPQQPINQEQRGSSDVAATSGQQQLISLEQLAALLAAAVGALPAAQRTGDHANLLLLLRCVRLLLPGALQRPGLLKPYIQAWPVEEGHGGSGGSAALSLSMAAVLDWVYSAAWPAFSGSKRKSAGMTAALVTSCLHPALFSIPQEGGGDDPRLPLHAPGGPVQRLVQQLLEGGERSWRLATTTSLQLCGLLACFPWLAQQYISILLQLLLSGFEDDLNVAGMGDVVLEPDSAAELAAVLQPTDPELAEAFAASPLAPRIAVASLLQGWVQQAAGGPAAGGAGWGMQPALAGGDSGAEAGAAREAGLLVWRKLLALSSTDPDLTKERYRIGASTHRKKVRCWQALCLLSPLVQGEAVPEAMALLMDALNAQNVPNVKQYQEILAVQLVSASPQLLRSELLPPLRDYTAASGRAGLASCLVAAAVGLMVLQPAQQQAGDEEQSQQQQQQQQRRQGNAPSQAEWDAMLGDLVDALTPWALSHVHVLRTFAQLILYRLLELFPVLLERNSTTVAVLRFFKESEDVQRLRCGLQGHTTFDAFDLARATSLQGLFCESIALAGSLHQGEDVFEGAPPPLLEVVQRFLSVERVRLRAGMQAVHVEHAVADLAVPAQLPVAAEAPAATSHQQVSKADTSSHVGQHQQQQQQQGQQSWQRKITPLGRTLAATQPWDAALATGALMVPGSVDPGEKELAAVGPAELAAQRGAPRQQLLVVASLLDKVPNLAGLARTCEVFRATGLVLADCSVAKQSLFTAISVTAEQWVPLLEVPEHTLAPWLQRKASEGWTLVGLEQTADSIRLQDYLFPERTALVLGREREGIPASILTLLQATVEIPQLGLIRSLNVHVSGAIAMYEFTRQSLASA